jgi:hypothetical protein
LRRGRGRDLRVEKGKKKGKRWIFDFDAIKRKTVSLSLSSFLSFPMNLFPHLLLGCS